MMSLHIDCCRHNDVSDWTRVELQLVAHETCRTSRLDLTTSKRGVIWFDQVSLMPSDTYRVRCILHTVHEDPLIIYNEL
jgi:hypothetical protein